MSVTNLSTFWQITIFVVSAIVIWFSGTKISSTTVTISRYFNIGEALGGMIFLAIVTNLPEIVITSVAAYQGNIEIACSNILGGIAIQTVVLVLIDVFGVGTSAPLTYRASSIELIIEGIILIFILTLVCMGKFISTDLIFLRITPIEFLILVVWIAGIYLISKKVKLPQLIYPNHSDFEEEQAEKEVEEEKKAITPAIIFFITGAILTFIAGWMLEISSEALANRFNISGAIFGATILAAATALPEISTGIATARLKDYKMAMSDIFGGNAFLPILFLLGSLISGKAILNNLLPSDLYLTGLSILLTLIYIIGLILRLKWQRFRMGLDSIVILIVYILGIVGLMFIR